MALRRKSDGLSDRDSGQSKGFGFVEMSDDAEVRVNGIVFSVPDSDYKRLLIREQNYKLIENKVFDFETDALLGNCQVFSANKQNGSYDFDGESQARYLQICLDSSKLHGERFYREFLDTTYIGDKRLSEFPDLINTM